MEIILQILGGIVLAIILLGVAVYVYFRIKFGKFLHLSEDETKVPLAIHINEDYSPTWLKEKRAIGHLEELERLGFTQGKAYTIHEMEGYKLVSFFRNPLVVVLYHYPLVGYWVDFVAIGKDGQEITVSNSPMGEEINNRPEAIRIFCKEKDIQELYEIIKEKVSDHDCIEIDDINFRTMFETAFKKDISWRNRHGGMSFEEFKGSAENAKFSSSSKNIRQAYIELKEQELDQWQNAALEEYRRDNKTEIEDYDDDFYSLFIVPEKTEAEAFINHLCDNYALPFNDAEKLISVFANETDIYALFEKLTESLSPDLRPEFVAESDFPLPLKIYKKNNEAF